MAEWKIYNLDSGFVLYGYEHFSEAVQMAIEVTTDETSYFHVVGVGRSMDDISAVIFHGKEFKQEIEPIEWPV